MKRIYIIVVVKIAALMLFFILYSCNTTNFTQMQYDNLEKVDVNYIQTVVENMPISTISKSRLALLGNIAHRENQAVVMLKEYEDLANGDYFSEKESFVIPENKNALQNIALKKVKKTFMAEPNKLRNFGHFASPEELGQWTSFYDFLWITLAILVGVLIALLVMGITGPAIFIAILILLNIVFLFT